MSASGTPNADASAAFGSDEGGPGRARTSPWPGILAIALGIAASTAWFVLGFVGLDRAIGDLERVPVPGQAVVELEAGRQAVYYESAEGSDAAVPGLQIRLVSPDGTAVPVGAHGGKVSYDVGGQGGRSVAGFEVPEDGAYRLTVVPTGAFSPGATLAVGPGVGGRIVRIVVGGVAIVLATVLLGVVLLVRARRRRTATRGSRGAAAPTAPPPPTPG